MGRERVVCEKEKNKKQNAWRKICFTAPVSCTDNHFNIVIATIKVSGNYLFLCGLNCTPYISFIDGVNLLFKHYLS